MTTLVDLLLVGPMLMVTLLLPIIFFIAPSGIPRSRERYCRILARVAGRKLFVPDYSKIEDLEQEIIELDPLNELEKKEDDIVDKIETALPYLPDIAPKVKILPPLNIDSRCPFCGPMPSGVSHKSSCPMFIQKNGSFPIVTPQDIIDALANMIKRGLI